MTVDADIAILTRAFEDLYQMVSNFRTIDVVPLSINARQTLTGTAGNKDFVADDTRKAEGLTKVDDNYVDKVFLIVQGVAVNDFAGTNALNCATASHNQWKINLDGGAYSDLVNGANADGQMNDNDWRCDVEGASHPFILMFDVTSIITNIDGNIGLRLENGRAEQANLIVTLSAFLRVVQKVLV